MLEAEKTNKQTKTLTEILQKQTNELQLLDQA